MLALCTLRGTRLLFGEKEEYRRYVQGLRTLLIIVGWVGMKEEF